MYIGGQRSKALHKKPAPPGTLIKDKLLCVDVRINRVEACRKTYLFLHILANQHVLFRVVGIAAIEDCPLEYRDMIIVIVNNSI